MTSVSCGRIKIELIVLTGIVLGIYYAYGGRVMAMGCVVKGFLVRGRLILIGTVWRRTVAQSIFHQSVEAISAVASRSRRRRSRIIAVGKTPLESVVQMNMKMNGLDEYFDWWRTQNFFDHTVVII